MSDSDVTVNILTFLIFISLAQAAGSFVNLSKACADNLSRLFLDIGVH